MSLSFRERQTALFAVLSAYDQLPLVQRSAKVGDLVEQLRHETVRDDVKPAETRELAITFGQRYAREPHEEGHEWVHPDGWLTVQYTVTEDGPAMCRERARTMAWSYLQGHYAFDYDMENLRAELYPRGELARMVLP